MRTICCKTKLFQIWQLKALASQGPTARTVRITINPLGAKVGYIRPIYRKFGTLRVKAEMLPMLAFKGQ